MHEPTNECHHKLAAKSGDVITSRLRSPDLISAAGAIFVLVSLCWWWYGDSIRSHFILNDLRHYAIVVRRSELSIDEKDRLIRVVHEIEDAVRDGNCPTYWDNTDEAVREMLADEITAEEVRLISLELNRVRDNLR